MPAASVDITTRESACSLVAKEWAARARAEREASVRFRGLAERLRTLDADQAVVAMADKAVTDEARHAALCDRTAERLGRTTCLKHHINVAEFAPQRLDPHARLLYEIVSFCCINESINAALLAVSLKLADDPDIKRAVREILADEVEHARLGWAHLASERARGRGEFLAVAIPRMLHGAVRGDELLALSGSSDHDDAEMSRLGYVSHTARVTLFCATLRDVVFPGLRACGIDDRPGQNWLRRQYERLPTLA